MLDFEVFSGMCDIPLAECVLSGDWRSCKILHNQHSQEAKQVSSYAVFVHIKQLNSYFKNLPNLYDSLKANSATNWLVPHADADHMTHNL